MPSVFALFITYFFIGAFLGFSHAPFLPFFIVGFGAMLFYFEDFEEWAYLITGLYLIFSFIRLVKGELISGAGLFVAGLITWFFSITKKRRNVDYSDPISVVSCTASGTSVALGFALALVKLSVWKNLDDNLKSVDEYIGLIKFAIAVLIAGFLVCLSVAAAISIYK